ncbi:hypothetical protein BaRGS_00004927 [Batillaria attramentaria]|uniref:Uncharacterized protein n=1 Tax=Batillaria attramentaria TaxID=370345 RepID=A0ABD0LW22_9CAEN
MQLTPIRKCYRASRQNCGVHTQPCGSYHHALLTAYTPVYTTSTFFPPTTVTGWDENDICSHALDCKSPGLIHSSRTSPDSFRCIGCGNKTYSRRGNKVYRVLERIPDTHHPTQTANQQPRPVNRDLPGAGVRRVKKRERDFKRGWRVSQFTGQSPEIGVANKPGGKAL